MDKFTRLTGAACPTTHSYNARRTGSASAPMLSTSSI